MTIVPINGSLPCLKYSPRPAGRRARIAAAADTRRQWIGELLRTDANPGNFQLIAGSVTRGPRARALERLQSFGKIDYKRICNGGPLALELSDGLFRGKESLRNVGLFMRLCGVRLAANAVKHS